MLIFLCLRKKNSLIKRIIYYKLKKKEEFDNLYIKIEEEKMLKECFMLN